MDKSEVRFNGYDADAPYYYDESWLLVHYGVFGSGDAGGGRLLKFLRLLNTSSATDAFQAAYGGTFEEIERGLRNYIQSGEYHEIRVKVPPGDAASQYKAGPAGDARVKVAMGALLLCFRGAGEAEPVLTAAEEEAPDDIGVERLLGVAAATRRDANAIVAHLGKVAASGKADCVDYCTLASAQAVVVGPHTALDSLRKAVALNADYQEAYDDVALLMGVATDIAGHDLALLDSGRRRFPSDLVIAVGEAIATAKTGDVQKGRGTLERLLKEHPDAPEQVKRLARGFLARLQAEDQ
jgi:hypothetical protein